MINDGVSSVRLMCKACTNMSIYSLELFSDRNNGKFIACLVCGANIPTMPIPDTESERRERITRAHAKADKMKAEIRRANEEALARHEDI